MEILDKTLFTSNKEDLKKIYEEEVQKLHENEFKLSLLKRLSIDDFPRDLTDLSKTNIEKALLAVRIKDHISFENGQKLLGLDDFDISKISLSYLEKKLIRERFEHLVGLEKKKKSQEPEKGPDELLKAQEKLIELQNEIIAMTETLAEMKLQELDLMKEVADVIVSPTQTKIVQGILDEARIVQLQTSSLNQVLKESEMTRTTHSKKAITEISGYIDELLEEKQNKSYK